MYSVSRQSVHSIKEIKENSVRQSTEINSIVIGQPAPNKITPGISNESESANLSNS
jgi:hypothetical protein